MKSKELLDLIHSGLLFWYNFKSGSTVLLLGKKACTLNVFIKECFVTEVENDVFSFDTIKTQKYDYIVVVSNLFFEESLDIYIQQLKTILNKNGQIILAVNNDIGTRLICGDEQPKLDGAIRLLNSKDLKITKNRLLKTINHSYEYCENFSVFPCLDYPQLIIRDGYIPNEKISSRITNIYNKPYIVFKQESDLIDFFQENEMIGDFANSFIFIFSDCPINVNVNSITMTLNRGIERACCTIIKEDATVEKKAFFPEKNNVAQNLFDNTCYLQNRNINMVVGEIKNNSYIMPFIESLSAEKYLFNLAFSDKEKFIKKIDEYVDIVFSSSEIVDNSNLGPIMKKGFIDLVPLNCFIIDEKFVFFDQEFFIENLPANVIVLRSLIVIYGVTSKLQEIIPIEFFFKRYGLDKCLKDLRKIESDFLVSLRNERLLIDYFFDHCISEEYFKKNTCLLNIFESKLGNDDSYIDSCFSNLENKKIILFGSGKYAEKFISTYSRKYEIVRIIDNDSKKWKTELNGVLIDSPELLYETQFAYKVIICMKDYKSVLRQLMAMHVKYIGIYDAKRDYDQIKNNDSYIDSCFSNLENKKIILFGSGKYAEKFISVYGRKYEIVRILDNDSKKWKTELNGILIDSPESLRETQFAYKVIICMKDYKSVLRQLIAMNVRCLSIYDAKTNYIQKPFRIGYLSGVFDLYHIGHINMFRRAKEQCDYLIVGVTSDEYVINKKQRTPFIPCDERIQVIRSCKYVDEVVKVPYMHEEITEAWETYHYDVQFCGSDYEQNPWWLEQKAWLEQHGATIIFFPYTQQTSSTKIKALIEKGLV